MLYGLQYMKLQHTVTADIAAKRAPIIDGISKHKNCNHFQVHFIYSRLSSANA